MVDVVVPTIGRASLAELMFSFARAVGPRPRRIFLVDDRRDRSTALDFGPIDDDLAARTIVLAGRAAGPASARNIGWRASTADWIAFVDDDVVVDDDWFDALARDLGAAARDVAGSQGRVRVPLPRDRRPTDWERNVASLESALWITADCAYRREVLAAVGGFDERFPRAYREDVDLALRVVARDLRIVWGSRGAAHPARPAPWWISIRLQRGNADDTLVDALHGSRWRERARSPRGAIRAHVATVTAAGLACIGFATRSVTLARLASLAWAMQTLVFALCRIVPGPRTSDEVVRMLATSVAIPFAAVWHRGLARARLGTLLEDAARAPQV